MARCALRRGVRFQANRFFSDVRPRRVEDRRVCRCVLANDVRCIPRGKRRRVHVRWGWGPLFHLRERRGLEAVQAGRRDVQGNATFREA